MHLFLSVFKSLSVRDKSKLYGGRENDIRKKEQPSLKQLLFMGFPHSD